MPSTYPSEKSEKKLEMNEMIQNAWRQVCNQPGALRCHPLPEIHKSMPQDQKRHKSNTAEPTIEHIFQMCSYLHSLCFCSIVSWPTPADHIRAVSPCHMYIHVRSAGMLSSCSDKLSNIANMCQTCHTSKAVEDPRHTLTCVCALQILCWAWHSERICSLSRSESTCKAMNIG